MITVINNIDISGEQLRNKKIIRQIMVRRIAWSIFTSLVLVALVWGSYEVSIKYNIIQYIVEEYLGKENDVAYAERMVRIVAEAVVAAIAILTVADWFSKSIRYISTEDLVESGGTYSDRYLAMTEKLQQSKLLSVWPEPGKESLWWFEFQEENGTVKKFAIELQKVVNNLISGPAIDLDHRSYIVRTTDEIGGIEKISVAPAPSQVPDVEVKEQPAPESVTASAAEETHADMYVPENIRAVPEESMADETIGEEEEENPLEADTPAPEELQVEVSEMPEQKEEEKPTFYGYF